MPTIEFLAEIQFLKEENKELLDIVMDSYNQACQCTDDKGNIYFDDMCMSTWESISYLLEGKGLLKTDKGRIYYPTEKFKEYFN